MEFEELAREVQNDRLEEERKQSEDIENRTRIIYSNFCIWCRVRDKYATEQEMNNFLGEEYPDLPFYLKKRLFEKYFSYVFSFDYNKSKWQCKKTK